MIHLNDVVRLLGSSIENHPFRHCCGMFRAEMAIGSGNQHAAVGVPEPSVDHFEVDAVLDGVAGEEVTEWMWQNTGRFPRSTRDGDSLSGHASEGRRHFL